MKNEIIRKICEIIEIIQSHKSTIEYKKVEDLLYGKIDKTYTIPGMFDSIQEPETDEMLKKLYEILEMVQGL